MNAIAPELRPHPLSRGFVWRDAEAARARRLTAGEVAAFNRDGFFRLEGVFTAQEIAAVAAAIDPLEAEQARFVRERKGGRYYLTDTEAITFTIHLVGKSEALKAFAAHPVFQDVCHDLIGDEVRLYWDQSVYKMTEKPRDFPWHQDNGYGFIEPQQYLTFWMPLVDVDEGNGCPWIAPGLHRRGTLEHWVTDQGRVCFDAEPQDAVAVPDKAGDVIVFSSLAPHRTGPNLSDDVRKAYILQYAPEGAEVLSPDGTRTPQTDPARQFRIL
jgi:ectoine hydroxylase-related dioxygenase (phytanoyl-CoA dioxygenase family)